MGISLEDIQSLDKPNEKPQDAHMDDGSAPSEETDAATRQLMQEAEGQQGPKHAVAMPHALPVSGTGESSSSFMRGCRFPSFR